MTTEPYRRPTRMYSGPLEATFPLDLTKHIALPAGATFKALSIDAIHVHYVHGKMVEHQFPNAMRSFNRCNGKPYFDDIKEGDVVFVGGAWFDEVADRLPGLIPAVDLTLVYDPVTGRVDGTVQAQHTPQPDGVPEEPSPLLKITLGYCLQYFPADI